MVNDSWANKVTVRIAVNLDASAIKKYLSTLLVSGSNKIFNSSL